MKMLVLGLALVSSALAAPALASASLDTTHPSNIVAQADTDRVMPVNADRANTDQAAPLDANVDHRNAAASLDMALSYRISNDFASVAPVQLLDQASFDFVPAAPMPMVRYAVLLVQPTDYLGAMFDPAMRAKRIV